jgi:hypothetical protein
MENPVRERIRQLSPQQKISAGLLGLVGLLAFGLAANQVLSQINAPFFVSKSVIEKANKFFVDQQAENTSLEASKTKDTDHDGLSDYDELYVYSTSPYLVDTDSDGLQDASEIAQGTDPNCPQGKVCIDTQGQVVATTSSMPVPGDMSPPVPYVGNTAASASSSAVGAVQSFLDNPAPPDSMTAAQNRAYFVAHNLVPKAEVDALPDSVVIQAYTAAYQDALRIQAASHPVTASSSSTTPAPIPSSPTAPTP